MPKPGEFSRSMISNIPADLNSPEAKRLAGMLQRFPDEAVYVYSFKEHKMLYANGWEEILGYRDDKIDMVKIVEITAPEYALFSKELNDKALQFLLTKTEDLEKYSFSIELKKMHADGHAVPLIVRVGVFRVENGKVTEIIGRNQINNSITLGKVMRYAAYGPEKSEFEEELSKELFQYFAISKKEKEALSLVAKGYSLKEIASHCGVSQSAIEKRIIPLYKKFNVRSLTHLVTFAFENHILP
jgi:DNA-binding CsgD family transcriptional regulator